MPDKWTWSAVWIISSPHSPDLTRPDFFLQFFMKSEKNQYSHKLYWTVKKRKQGWPQIISKETLKNVWENMNLRLIYVTNENKGYVEKLLHQ